MPLIKKTKLKKLFEKHARGFTLMEIIVVMGVFVTTVLVVTDIFFTVNRVQRRTQLTQEIQSDARFAIEAITREVRLGTIAYDKYTAGYLDTMPKPFLITRDQEGNVVFYRRSPAEGQSPGNFEGDDLLVCSAPTDDETRCAFVQIENYQSVTPPNVKIKDLKFYISPASDPYLPPPTSSSDCNTVAGATFNENVGACECIDSIDCWTGQTCEAVQGTITKVCVNVNEQPRVTIVLATETVSQIAGESQQSFLQTTVESRVYKR